MSLLDEIWDKENKKQVEEQLKPQVEDFLRDIID